MLPCFQLGILWSLPLTVFCSVVWKTEFDSKCSSAKSSGLIPLRNHPYSKDTCVGKFQSHNKWKATICREWNFPHQPKHPIEACWLVQHSWCLWPQHNQRCSSPSRHPCQTRHICHRIHLPWLCRNNLPEQWELHSVMAHGWI